MVSALTKVADIEDKSKDRSAALLHFLALLAPWMDDPSITEICINRPGGLFTETRAGFSYHACEALNFDTLMQMARLIATNSNQKIDEMNAILSATLPGGQRCQIILPPACEAGTVSFTIRKPSTVNLTLDDYERQGAFDDCIEPGAAIAPHEQALLDLKHAGKYRDFLQLAVQSHQNIIVSGATGSGKTTFTKAIIQEIPTHERLISIENVSELKLNKTHPNSVALFYSAGGQGLSKASPQLLMQSALRMKPDRVMLAELIAGDEAFYFMDTVSSGHPGSITTMHSENPRMCVERLIQLIRRCEVGATMTTDDIRKLIFMCIDVIVQFKVVNKKRVVTEIYYDPEHKRSAA